MCQMAFRSVGRSRPRKYKRSTSPWRPTDLSSARGSTRVCNVSPCVIAFLEERAFPRVDLGLPLRFATVQG